MARERLAIVSALPLACFLYQVCLRPTVQKFWTYSNQAADSPRHDDFTNTVQLFSSPFFLTRLFFFCFSHYVPFLALLLTLFDFLPSSSHPLPQNLLTLWIPLSFSPLLFLYYNPTHHHYLLQLLFPLLSRSSCSLSTPPSWARSRGGGATRV